MTRTVDACPTPGVYAATLTFFDSSTQDLDLESLERHIIRLIQARLSGIVALGSNGEAAHLTREERVAVVTTISRILKNLPGPDLPLIVGCSAYSVRETVALCRDAASAGGSHALVLPPSYYIAAMTEDAIYQFYMEIATASPIPIIIYSFPAVTGGIEMTSDLIIRVSRGHENVVGTKFTCGDTGKLARVARAMNTVTPKNPDGTYWAVAGLADFMLQALVVGASGVIAGGANILPKTCTRVYDMFCKANWEEAVQLQTALAQGDWPHTAAGLGGTKAVLQRSFGYGGLPRPPLSTISCERIDGLILGMKEILLLEESL